MWRKLIVFIFLFVIGCQQIEPTATPLPPSSTPTATQTPTPTNTPTATPTNTPSPTNTPTNTPSPTATNTPRPTNTATVAPTATPLAMMQYTEADVLMTVVQIAAAQGLPLSADNSTLILQDGLVTIESIQLFFGQQIVSNFVVRFVVVEGEPVAMLEQADISGEPLPPEAVASIEQEITRGFSAELRADTNYTSVQSITITDGLLTVIYQ